MSFKLNVSKTNVTETFIIVIFVFFVILKDENRLLSKVNKMFIRLFFIKGFFEFNLLCEVMTTTIQFTNLMKKILYMLMLHHQLNNN